MNFYPYYPYLVYTVFEHPIYYTLNMTQEQCCCNTTKTVNITQRHLIYEGMTIIVRVNLKNMPNV